MKKVAIIHTSLVSIEKLKELFSDIIPEVKVYNIIDDSLLAEVMENNAVTQGIIDRMQHHVNSAEIMGADVILSQCSSMGPAIDIVENFVKIPILKIDRAMAEQAVLQGSKIAVVATVTSTMKPSCDLIRSAAKGIGRKIEIIEALVDGALDILLKEGDKEKHNKMVLEKINDLDGKCDVIVLAQGSMIVLLPELNNIKTPVLTSPESGVWKMREVLGLDEI
jgi:Asp/Glu/hydantoin racemase